MPKHSYSKKKKKLKIKKLRRITTTLLGISTIIFGIVSGKTYLIHTQVNATQKALTRINQEKTELKQQVEALDAETHNLETASEKLELILWRFEPVIVPESMKN